MTRKNIIGFIKNPFQKKYWRYFVRGVSYCVEVLIDETFSQFQHVNEKPLVPIKISGGRKKTVVEEYWGGHTVQPRTIKSPFYSKHNLEGRFRWYPKFKELMDLYGEHKGETILDYGCGPGNDVVGFSLFSRAKKVIGVDVSKKALEQAQRRIYLHDEINPRRIELIQVSEEVAAIPLENSTIDYIYSEGVLHHTSNMAEILKEFRRVLKRGSFANIMIYNKQSVFFHLHLAYEKMIVEKRFNGLNITEAFTKSTDGPDCPISKCFTALEFIKIGKKAGFRGEYLGGYLSKTELDSIKQYVKAALKDRRLALEHKKFLRALTYDQKGLPMYEGKYAGIGGVYRFYKDS